MKEKLKKIPFLVILNKKIKFKKEYKKDYKFFLENYSYSNPTKSKIEYNMILEVHKLEKGMACINPRPFGVNKVKELMRLIIEYEKISNEKSYSYNLANSALLNYTKFYEEHGWKNTDEYKIISRFISKKRDFDYIEVGSFDLKKKAIIKDASIDYDKFLSSRRSIRNFSSTKLKKEDIEKAVKMAIKTPTACNRQMCKIYYINNDEKKDVVTKYAQGVGLFDLTNVNYFIITFDISANYFIGERNQGWFNSGLFSMNFANALHSLGIGSCFIQFGNSFEEEEKLKKILNIPESERIAVILTAGYYDEISKIPYSTRKDLKEIFKIR